MNAKKYLRKHWKCLDFCESGMVCQKQYEHFLKILTNEKKKERCNLSILNQWFDVFDMRFDIIDLNNKYEKFGQVTFEKLKWYYIEFDIDIEYQLIWYWKFKTAA